MAVMAVIWKHSVMARTNARSTGVPDLPECQIAPDLLMKDIFDAFTSERDPEDYIHYIMDYLAYGKLPDDQEVA